MAKSKWSWWWKWAFQTTASCNWTSWIIKLHWFSFFSWLVFCWYKIKLFNINLCNKIKNTFFVPSNTSPLVWKHINVHVAKIHTTHKQIIISNNVWYMVFTISLTGIRNHFWWSLCRYQITCFLSCYLIQCNLFSLNATVSPLVNFFFTPADGYFLFEQTVPVKFVLSNNNNSAKGTAVYQLSVKRWYPWLRKGAISSMQMSCEILYLLLEFWLPS